MWSDLASTRDAQGTLQCLGFLVEQLAKVAIALRTKAIVGHCHELTIGRRPVSKIDPNVQSFCVLQRTSASGSPRGWVLPIIDTPPLGVFTVMRWSPFSSQF